MGFQLPRGAHCSCSSEAERLPGKKEAVGPTPTWSSVWVGAGRLSLLTREAGARKGAAHCCGETRISVPRTYPGERPRSSVEELLGPNERVAGSSPAEGTHASVT